MKTDKQIAAAAAEFAIRWKGRGYERGESQPFWIDLLSNRQSDGALLNPFQQARRYVAELFKLYQYMTEK